MGIWDEAWDGLKQGAGDVANEGAQVLGDGLDAAGLHSEAQFVETEGDKIGFALGGDVGELQLGQADDPRELVHGEVARLRAAADDLKRFREGFGQVADGLSRVDTGHWEGAAADAFRARFSPEPAKWGDAATAMGGASAALEAFAGAVQSAQQQAQRAIDLWNQGQEATRQAASVHNQQVSAFNSAAQAYSAQVRAGHGPGVRPTPPGAFSDPGEALREEARQVLGGARQERNASAASATAAVRNAAGLAPKAPSFLGQLSADVSDTFRAGMLADASLGAGVLEGVAGIGKFARTLNPLDPSNMSNPVEYLAGLSGTAAGLASSVMDPAKAVKGLLGTGWGSDPVEALGKLIPGVALAVATDGGGAAADAGDAAAGIGEDTAENTAASTAENMVSRPQDAMHCVKDPVDIATGDVVMTQTDVSLPGVLPLVLKRAHRSSQRGGRWFGESWASSLDQRLLVAGDRVAAVFPDGQVMVYPRAELASGGPILPRAGAPWPLARDADADGVFTVTNPQVGLTWRYEERPGFPHYPDGQGELPLVSVTDRAGHTITFGYDGDARPVSVTHSGGYHVNITITSERITALSSGGVTLAAYEYDDAGNLASVVNSSGQPQRFTYDESGRLAKWADRNGSSYSYMYDDEGRCLRGESPSGAMSASFSYGDGVTRCTGTTGDVTAYTVDRAARVTAITNPLGGTTRFTYDARNRKTSEADPLGRVTAFAYDAAGHLTAVTRPDGAIARVVYDDRCHPVELHEPGRPVRYQEFDDWGNRTAVTRPDGAVIRYAYDDARHLASVTGADGTATTVTCDALGLPTAMTAPDGVVTRYERDALGNCMSVTGPDGGVTSMTWTPEGHPLTRTFPDGSAESWEWDGEGNLLRHVSPSGSTTTYEHGPFDEVTTVTGPDGTCTSYEYDAELRLTNVQQGGLTWTYVLDAAGRVTGETDYNGAVTRYELDAAGQVTRKVNSAGQVNEYAYDALGNAVAQTTSNGVTTFTYDQAGDLIAAANHAASLTFERDALGRITAETCNGHTVTTTYDVAGRVTSRATPSGAVSTWTYDVAGLPASLTSDRQTLRFGHDPGGRETFRELPGGARLAQDWDSLGRLTSQLLTRPAQDPGSAEMPGPAATLQQRRYTYTPDGYVTALADHITGTRTFALDAVGRVTSVTGTNRGTQWAEQYSYDALGNITTGSWPDLSGVGTEAAPAAPRAVAGTLTRSAGKTRYRHDSAGRVTQRSRSRLSRRPDTWHYQWDPDNRLIAAETPDGAIWHYAYDPLGRRILKQQAAPDGTILSETRFTWDGAVLAEQSETVPGRATEGNPEHVTTWDYRPGSFTPLTQTTRTAFEDAPQDVIDAEFHAIITDLTGTPTELVTPHGSIDGFQQHTLWGATAWHPGGATTPFRFPGQYADEETGLCYNHHRYYDPASGTYLSPDPLGISAGPNPHAYVSNPQVLIDPLGLMSCEEQPAVGGDVMPHGFASSDAAAQFTNTLNSGLRAAGYPDTQAAFQGSSVTGVGFRSGRPFGSHSDYDIALGGNKIFNAAKENGVGLRSGGTRTGPLRPAQLDQLGLSGMHAQLERMAGREVHFMVYQNIEGALSRSPSMVVPHNG